MQKERLMIPGPTTVPPAVYRALGGPVFGHRGPAMPEAFFHARNGLRQVFQTEHELVLFAASGTAAMESAVVNLTEAGDRVLVTVMGAFGRRFAEIAATYGCQVERLEVGWGDVVAPEMLRSRLEDPDGETIRAVFATHNETSTGVTLDLAAYGEILRDHPAYLAVDAVSSLGAIDLQTDAWNIDAVCTSSQKALMTPPGLSIAAVSPAALRRAEENSRPRFYLDWNRYRTYAERGQTPFTPAISLIRAVAAACDLILDEGLPTVFRRHARMRQMVRAGGEALGLVPLVPEAYASNSVTALTVPGELSPDTLRERLRQDFDIALAGGKGPLADRVVRVGHMGYTDEADILQTLAALEQVFSELGHDVTPGTGVAAARTVLTELRSEVTDA